MVVDMGSFSIYPALKSIYDIIKMQRFYYFIVIPSNEEGEGELISR